MPRPAARAALAAWALLAVAAFAGCAAPAPNTAGGRGGPLDETTRPPAVAVEFVQLRADVAPRQAQVRVTNGTGEALRVGAVRVEDARFDAPATRVVAGRASRVPAGGVVDVRVQLPPADCAAPDEGEVRVVLELETPSGARTVEAVAPDPLGFVAPLHARECLHQSVGDAASLAFTGFIPSPAGAPATLVLTVAPTGDGAARVSGIRETNLLDFGVATVGAWFPLELDIAAGDAAPITVEVPIEPTRCDPHAVMEDKRGTVFGVRAEAGGRSGQLDLYVGDELRGEVLAWVGAWCGFGG